MDFSGLSWPYPDLLCTRGRAQIAVEIQWSGQTLDHTIERQAAYAAAGVRCCWLMRRPPEPHDVFIFEDWRRVPLGERSLLLNDEDVPIFGVERSTKQPSGYEISINGHVFDATVFAAALLQGGPGRSLVHRGADRAPALQLTVVSVVLRPRVSDLRNA